MGGRMSRCFDRSQHPDGSTMEHSFIAWAKQRSSKLPQVKLGIGDDCALLAGSADDCVVTTDSLCDGTHFILSECGGRRAGRKLLGVSLSDLASMGATPVAAFLSLCLPRASAGDIAAEVFEGVLEMAREYAVAIAGGDTNVWDGPLALHLTAIGSVAPDRAWKRSGAKTGDAIVVTGTLGGSILGKHLDFEPRLRLANQLAQLDIVSAATDISDGLGIDLLNMTVASRCGAEVDLSRIPISDAARRLAESTGRSPLDHALGDGEDFELLLAIPKEKVDRLPAVIGGVPLTRIGEIVGRTGLWSKEKGGVKQLPPRGYVHG
ncbi:Thiamine-monophosphate kinase [Pirellula sp. SH-Sr6A]|nr:Thiamine-monophosphate kinase [Pirellula sp. SH-Sr6A]